MKFNIIVPPSHLPATGGPPGGAATVTAEQWSGTWSHSGDWLPRGVGRRRQDWRSR